VLFRSAKELPSLNHHQTSIIPWLPDPDTLLAPNMLYPDLIIRITLVLDDDNSELTPSIWRRFRVNAGMSLEAFQDKILQPIMGWTRNYHSYYFDKGGQRYINEELTSRDAATTSLLVTPSALPAEKCRLSDLLTKENDELVYVYDLGCCWRHTLRVEQRIVDGAHGKCLIVNGAMRCPDEDGGGCRVYQSEVLDLLNRTRSDPTDLSNIREFAHNCFRRHTHMNVRNRFDPQEFDLAATQLAIHTSLRSRISARNGGGKMIVSGNEGIEIARLKRQAGQRIVRTQVEDGFHEVSLVMTEVVNWKPDDPSVALCVCGNPNNLRTCSACHVTSFCSRECQKREWPLHKQICRDEKAKVESFQEELEGKSADAAQILDSSLPVKAFDPSNLRFRVGDRVECIMGEELWATGRIVQTHYKEDDMEEMAPYQVKLDAASARRLGAPSRDAALIYAPFDDDYYIRKLPYQKPKFKPKRIEYEIVD